MSFNPLFPHTPSKWEWTTLGELAKESGGDIQTGPFGSQLHARDYVDDGIPSIMPKNISIDTVLTEDIARVSADDINRLAKYKVQTGDIVYSRRGDVEKCSRITEREDGWLCGTGCLRVRVLPGKVSTEYLHAYLCHPSVREWIVRHAVGATMPNLNTSILSALPVIVPTQTEMEKVASIWLSLSGKIQINNQINQTLEQMAQAIFKSWFVDFEPVKAKIAALEAGGSEEDALLAAMQAIYGKPADELAHLQAEYCANLRATAELFPSAMQESELGDIPEGWNVSPVSELFELHRGFDLPQKKRQEGAFDVYAAGGLHGTHNEYKMMPPGIITGRSGVIGNVYLSLKKYWPLNTTLYVREFRQSGPYFAYHLLKSLDLKSLNSGSAVPSLNRNFVHSMRVVKPAGSVLEIFELLVSTLFRAMVENIDQNETLEEVRDILLPKLLSGELTVPEEGAEEHGLREAAHV